MKIPVSIAENCDCMDLMSRYPDKFFELAIVDDLQAGKAGEYLVCADLILKGFVAYPSEQGLPYDVVMDFNGRLLKVQVKATRGLRNVPQRKIPVNAYVFNIKRRGKRNKNRHTSTSCDLYALVALDTKEIGYMINRDVKDTMNFRCNDLRGKYRDENINIKSTGKYLTELTLENCLNQL
jgi:hypothetical protein